MVLSKFFTRFAKSDRQKSENNNHVTGDIIGEKGKLCQCRILLLDDTEFSLDVKTGAKSHLVLNCVFDHLNLLEKDYFGLRYLDETNQTHWLESAKNIGSQLKTPPPHTLYFGVKFYAADPCKLHEEITRYQFFLQLKKDVLQGRLPVQFDLATELSSYAVQSELGDFDPKRHTFGYVSEFRFVPNQTEDFEERVMSLHKTLLGQVPAVAEYRYLDKAKWLEMYGVDLHPVLGEGNLEYFLGLTPTGIVVYRNKQKVGSYFWPRLTKVTFKGKMFLVRVKDKSNEDNTYAFDCATKPACKHLWKCCIEHHAFFRLTSANESYKEKGKLFSFGSKHRFSGRTAKQAMADASNRQQPKVVRRPSKRHQRRESVESMPNGFKPYHRDSDVDAVMMGPDHEPHGRDKGYQSAPESPRSCRSVPWENKRKSGGLFTSGGQSPTSVVSERMMFPRRQYESESEGGPRRRHHKSRADPSDSDGESLYTRKCRVPAEYTEASESESELRTKHRKYRKSTENVNQHDNWLDMQRRIRDGGFQGPLQLKPHISGSMSSVASGDSRRRRRRSKSPGNRKPPEELAEHFRYIDPEVETIPQDMIVDIPYTAVQTTEMLPKFKQHAHRRHRSKSPKTKRDEMLEKAGSAVGSIISSNHLSQHHHQPSSHDPPPHTHSQQQQGGGYHHHQSSHHHHQSQQGAGGSRHSQHVEPEPPPPYSENHGLHPPIQPTYNVQRGLVSTTASHSQAHGPGQYKPSHTYGQLQHPEYDSMRSPVSVQRNETYSAPIVKTNTAKSYNNNGTYSQPPPYTMSGQSMYNTKQNPGQGFHDHMREDSGLGIESNNSSRQTSAVLYPDQYYQSSYQSAQGSPASYTQQHTSHHNQYSHSGAYTEQALSKSSYPGSSSLQYHNQHPHSAGPNYNTSQMNGYPGGGGSSTNSSKQNQLSSSSGRVASYHQDNRHQAYNLPPTSHSYNPHKGGWMEGGGGAEYNTDYYHHQQQHQQRGGGGGGGGGTDRQTGGGVMAGKGQRNEKTTEL